MLYKPQSLRQCTKCGEWRFATKACFSPDTHGREGLHTNCRECKRLYDKTNKRDRREYLSKYYMNNRDRELKNRKEYYNSNRDKMIERNHRYYATHQEEILEQKRQYLLSHRNQIQRYRLTNKERIVERSREYYRSAKGLQLARVNSAHRRARKLAVGGTHTVADIQCQYTKQEGKCFYCKCELGDKYHADHYIPLVKGGSNAAENIVVACRLCNQRKHDKMPDVFLAELAIEHAQHL